jgi:hypothetical protein
MTCGRMCELSDPNSRCATKSVESAKRSRLIGSVEPSPPSSGRFDSEGWLRDDEGPSPIRWRSAEEE